MTGPLSDQRLDEIAAHVPNCRYGCDACEAFPALVAEVRGLRAQIGRAHTELRRQHLRADHTLHPDISSPLMDALEAVETHLTDPEHRPAAAPESLLEQARRQRTVGPHPAPGEDAPTHAGPGESCQDPACVKARAQHEAVADIQDLTAGLFGNTATNPEGARNDA